MGKTLPPANNAEPHADNTEPEDGMEVNTSTALFTPPEPSPTYAEAATGTTADENFTRKEVVHGIETLQNKQEKYLAQQRGKSGRKRDPPPPMSSDDKKGSAKKANNATPNASPESSANTTTTNTEPAALTGNPDKTPSTGESTSTPSLPSPSGLKKFMTALAQGGPLWQMLMKAVPAIIYY